jgi:hypothetical protein
MLWMISMVLVILWLLALIIGYTLGSFIHILFLAAFSLLVVSLSQEVIINRKLKYLLRKRGLVTGRKQGNEQLTDPLIL